MIFMHKLMRFIIILAGHVTVSYLLCLAFVKIWNRIVIRSIY